MVKNNKTRKTSYGARALFAALPALVLAGCVASAHGPRERHFASLSVVEPSSSRVTVCHGFGCIYTTPVTVTRSDVDRLRAIMRTGATSPAEERKAVGRAIQWLDKRFGKIVGTHIDVGGFDPGNARKRGQQDCIDEATTTAGFLVMMEANGLLKHHTAGKPVARGFFLDGRYPHATATVLEKDGGNAFAVDPWPYKAGSLPDVIPVERWMRERGGVRATG
ncbi:MAG: hypothetical protein AAF638_02760 [Pseudomonadota bacterium]